MSRRTAKRQRFAATGSARPNAKRLFGRDWRRSFVEWAARRPLWVAFDFAAGPLLRDGTPADPEKFGVIAVDAKP